jgi:hypothetical protein
MEIHLSYPKSGDTSVTIIHRLCITLWISDYFSREYRYINSLGAFCTTLNGLETFESLLYVLLHAKLRGEDVPYNAFLVYNVRNPTGKESEGVGNTIEPSYLPSLIAEQGKREIVL